MLSAATYLCNSYGIRRKGGVGNANGRIRRWLPRGTDLDEIGEQDIKEIALTINLTRAHPAQVSRLPIPG